MTHCFMKFTAVVVSISLLESQIWVAAADHDIVIYGATSAAVVAAVQAKKWANR